MKCSDSSCQAAERSLALRQITCHCYPYNCVDQCACDYISSCDAWEGRKTTEKDVLECAERNVLKPVTFPEVLEENHIFIVCRKY